MKSKMVSTTAGLFALLKIIAIMIIGLLTTTATTTATTTTTVTCVLGGGGMGLSMPSMSFNGFVSTSRSRRRRIAKLLWSQKSDVVYRHPHKYNKIHAIQTRGGAAAAAAADDGETIINKKKRVRVALIGSGRMGHVSYIIL